MIYLCEISQEGDTSQDEHEAAFKFIEEVHSCPAV